MAVRALFLGLISLLHPRMLALMILPLIAAGLVWLVAVVSFWGTALSWIDARLAQWEWLQWPLQLWPLSLVASHAAATLLVLGLVPVVLVLSTLLTGMFAMPLMVAHVSSGSHASLDRRHGGSFSGGVRNGLAACMWFLLLVIVTLPFWLIPPLWPVLSLGLLGFLNQRVYPYDALAEHASRGELAQLLGADRWPLFWLGVAVALASHIPFLGFFAPVYGGLVFVHYCLARLAELRAAPVEGQAARVAEDGSAGMATLEDGGRR